MSISKVGLPVSLVLLIAVFVVGRATLNADEPEAKPAPAEAEPAEKEEVDRYAVPETDSVDDLLAFIKEVESIRPTDRKSYFEHRSKGPVAILAAAEAIQKLEKDESSAAYKLATGYIAMQRAGKITQVEPAEQKEILAGVVEHIGEKGIAPADLRSLMSIASGLEYSGNSELAATAYRDFGALVKKSDNPQLAAMSGMFEGAARRLELPGHEMELTGTTVDGKPFEISELKGKTVLVDFWATWCGPCVAEYPNMLKNYKAYHDKGFEIVGISLDQDRDALENYLKEKEVPWITLHEKDGKGQHPAAQFYGIMGIPSMILIGEDGKVVSLRARGAELTKLLEAQYGKPAPAEAEAGGQ